MLPSSWPADHSRVQSPDPVWFPLAGQGGYFTTSCLHFTLGAKESEGTWEKNVLTLQGARTRGLFLDWTHPAIVGDLAKSGTEVHRERKPTALQQTAISACRLELMKDCVCNKETKAAPTWANVWVAAVHCKTFPARKLLHNVQNSQTCSLKCINSDYWPW